MTSDEMWEQLIERHPSFADESNLVSLRARGLKALLKQAWDEGYDTAVRKNADIFTNTSLFNRIFKN